MWELDHKEGWVPKNWCSATVVLEQTLQSPLESKEMKLVNTKGNQLWIFIGRTEAEVEAPILWPPDAKGQLTRKDSDARKDWRQKEKEETKNEMVDCITDSMDMSLRKLWERMKDREAWHGIVHVVTQRWTWLSNWTTKVLTTHNQDSESRLLITSLLLLSWKVNFHFLHQF